MSLPPSEIPLGAIRFNSDSSKLEYWNGNAWFQIQTFSPNLGDTQSTAGARGLFTGGSNPSKLNTIDYVTISSGGDAQDFGDLANATRAHGAAASRIRGVNTNVIQFITFATTGNAQDFGDVDYSGGARASGGFSSPTRGVFAGGADSPSNNAINIIHFVTLASTGNSTDFGDISAAKRIEGGGTSLAFTILLSREVYFLYSPNGWKQSVSML